MGLHRGWIAPVWVTGAACLLAMAAWAADETPRVGSPPPQTPAAPGPEELAAAAPYLIQLAALDPVLAASLVPDPWIDSLLRGALAVEAEVPALPAGPDPPHRGPVGPWRSADALAQAIDAADPVAAGALYRALGPRLRARCGAMEREFPACERALRAAGDRLAARAVIDRAGGGPPAALTPTQRELARLGVPVAAAVRRQTHALGSVLWGRGWQNAR